MTGGTGRASDTAIEIAGILDAFRAEERGAALAAAKNARLTFTRNVGSGAAIAQVGLEAVIDQASEADEIFSLLQHFDQAIDRHKAKIDIADNYARIAMKLGEIETAARDLVAQQERFQEQNATRNATRRNPVAMTELQRADLKTRRTGIEEAVARVAELWKAIEDGKAILAGADPLAAVERALRARQEAAHVRIAA